MTILASALLILAAPMARAEPLFPILKGKGWGQCAIILNNLIADLSSLDYKARARTEYIKDKDESYWLSYEMLDEAVYSKSLFISRLKREKKELQRACWSGRDAGGRLRTLVPEPISSGDQVNRIQARATPPHAGYMQKTGADALVQQAAELLGEDPGFR